MVRVESELNSLQNKTNKKNHISLDANERSIADFRSRERSFSFFTINIIIQNQIVHLIAN